jgi:hypothetical protein
MAKAKNETTESSDAPAAGQESPAEVAKPVQESPAPSSKRKQILDRAAVIAGQIASASVIEGLLQGSHATTVSLSAIRVAVTLDLVADKVEECPELLTMPIGKAHDLLDEMIRADRAEAAAE